MPLLVACSSSIKTAELENRLQKIGFNIFIEQPITNDIVTSIIEILVKREVSIEEVNNIVNKSLELNI